MVGPESEEAGDELVPGFLGAGRRRAPVFANNPWSWPHVRWAASRQPSSASSTKSSWTSSGPVEADPRWSPRRRRPGPARSSTPISAYEAGAIGTFCQWITSAGPEVYTNDSAKLARAILDTTRDPQPPLRLTLGGDAYEMIHTALRAQIEAR